MKLHEAMIVEKSDVVLDGLGDEAVGLYAAVERKLALIDAPGITWEIESGETSFVGALAGKFRDFLTIRHDRFREYTVLVSARRTGRVLHLSWIVVARARLMNDLKRAVRLDGEAEGRFQLGAELDFFDALDLNDFFAVTKLAFRAAVREFGQPDEAEDDHAGAGWSGSGTE